MTMRKGRFEAANKGTIFLDEIGEMTLGTQTKLLRILQEREFERIGSNLPIKVDLRVIAATNRELAEEVEAGRFREDLYYRLNVIHIHMPPLRDRLDDVPLLVEHFLAKFRFKPDAIPTTISEEAMARLGEHDWPGNVRELENAIERAVVLSRGQPIMPDHLPLAESPAAAGGKARTRRGTAKDPIQAAAEAAVDEALSDAVGAALDKAMGGSATGTAGSATNGNANGGSNGNGADVATGSGGASFKEAVESLEKRLIAEALERNGGNRSKAAEELGIYRRLLYAKMREYGLGE
jgi:DNA-binding NtrC family response regulator